MHPHAPLGDRNSPLSAGDDRLVRRSGHGTASQGAVRREPRRRGEGVVEIRRSSVDCSTTAAAPRCDIAIDPQSLSKSAVAAWLSGAKRRIGFAKPQGREVAPWMHTEIIDAQATHVVDKYLELLHPLDIVNEPVRFGFLPDAASVLTVERFLHQHHLESALLP